VLVLIMGVKDVTSDHFLKELRYLLQFVNQNTQTNIILLTVPLRYDQGTNVYVNDDIKKFNRKIRKYMKLSEHVTVLETPQDREYFTRHGLHFNGSYKQPCAQSKMWCGKTNFL
jgi:predicted nucleotide-binding protein (sugar kinase/HSP70/actin superfamily)